MNKMSIIEKLDFYRFQVLVKVDKDHGNPDSKSAYTKVYTNFEFVEPLISLLDFYYKEPYRATYMAMKAFFKVGKTHLFTHYRHNDVAISITIHPFSGAKLPKTMEDFELLVLVFDKAVEEWFVTQRMRSAAYKLGESLRTLG